MGIAIVKTREELSLLHRTVATPRPDRGMAATQGARGPGPRHSPSQSPHLHDAPALPH